MDLTKAQAIATLLHGTATEGSNTATFYITLADGVVLFLRVGDYSNGGRLHVDGSYPSYTDANGNRRFVTPRDCGGISYGIASPSITVAGSKTAEQIAKDIDRRLLPELRPLWLKCREYANKQVFYLARRKATIERVAKATKGTPRSDRDLARVDWAFEVGHAEYRGGYNNQAELFEVTLRDVTEAQLVKLLEIVK